MPNFSGVTIAKAAANQAVADVFQADKSLSAYAIGNQPICFST
jgi:hypothetical protein